jgi:uncharacterized UBP type Zn finger protein
MEAINRLVSLGFPKHRAKTAYVTFNKNEEMAANFLVESGGFDNDDHAMQYIIAASLQ